MKVGDIVRIKDTFEMQYLQEFVGKVGVVVKVFSHSATRVHVYMLGKRRPILRDKLEVISESR